MIVSGVLEVIKKGSKKEYTKRAGKAFIDFLVYQLTMQVSLQGLFPRFSLPDTTYKSHAFLYLNGSSGKIHVFD